MELSQLPVELGGTLDYDHFAWLKTRKVSYLSKKAMACSKFVVQAYNMYLVMLDFKEKNVFMEYAVFIH